MNDFTPRAQQVLALARKESERFNHNYAVWRWVQSYAPKLERRLRQSCGPPMTVGGWTLTYIRVKGKWVYLYRAVDSSGATIDFLLSAKRDAAAAERILAKALGAENHPAPRVIWLE
jgi:transposase, IS6 family